MSGYVVAIDQGTTGTTVLVLDERLALVGRGYREFAQVYPQPGWVEHDPQAIWRSVTDALAQALEAGKVGPKDVRAIGITNQRETTLAWERDPAKGGRPLHNAIVWQDRRTADRCAALRAGGHLAAVQRKTGLVLDPYFSATKLEWLLQRAKELLQRSERGEVCFGTVDSYLVFRLTGGAAHVTDVSNASRTLLCDIHRLAWDDELCALFGVPRSALPEIRGNAEVYGTTRGVPGIADGTPVCGMAGDQQAALFGQACFEPGDAKCTYGTGAFLLMNTGDRAVPSTRGMLTTVGWKLPDAGVSYALEGAAFVAGAMVQWLRDGLGIIRSASEIEALARSVPDAGGVVAVPALAGLGAPHWRPEARGVLVGLTRGTTKAHIARAVLEGIALMNVDILRAMEEDSGRQLTALKVDGGASANDLLMQYQADVLGVPLVRPALVETTAIGAALLAGIGGGVWKGLDDARRAWREERRFTPAMPPELVRRHIERWNASIEKC